MGSGWKRAIAALAIVAAIGWREARLPDEPASSGDEAFVPDPGLAQLAALGFDARASPTTTGCVRSRSSAAGRPGGTQ